MIDFEKLKLVNKIVEDNLFNLSVCVTYGEDGDKYCDFEATLALDEGEACFFTSVDDLLAKLQSAEHALKLIEEREND